MLQWLIQVQLNVDLTGIQSLEELADVLNRSRDVQGNAHNFRSMGLFASGGGSTLQLQVMISNFLQEQ